jgi:antirestriction protein ArdC
MADGNKFELVAGEWAREGAPLFLPSDQPWPRRLEWTDGGWEILPEGGFNVFALMRTRAQKKYARTYWLTVRTGERLGGVLKPHAQGVAVAQWRWAPKTNIFQGDITPRMAGTVEKPFDELDLSEEAMAVAMRPVILYNADAWDFPDGLELPAEPNYHAPTPDEAREAAERMLQTECDATLRYEGSSAYYNPSLHEIVLPPRESYRSLKEFYRTAFEQIGLALAGRKGMDLWQAQGGVDFSKDVAIKKLYAKMIAAMMAYESGIDVL